MKIDLVKRRKLIHNIHRTLLEYWQVDKAGLLGYGSAAILQVATSIGSTYYGSKLLGQISIYLFRNGHNTHTLYILLGVTITLLLLENIAWIIISYVQQNTYIKWQMHIAPIFMERIAQLDLPQFEDPSLRLALDKVREGYDWKPSHYITTLLELTHGLFRLIGVGLAAATLTWWVLPLIILAGFPTQITQNMEAKKKWGIWQTKGDDKHIYYQIAQLLTRKETVGEIKILGIGHYLAQKCGNMLANFMQAQQKVMKRYLGATLVSRTCASFATGFVQLWLLVKLIHRTPGFDIGKYSYYTGIIYQFNSSFGIVTGSLAKLYDVDLFMTDYFSFIDTKPVLNGAENARILSAKLRPRIEFKDVSFRYPNAEALLLDGLNLTIESGEHVALVGENGAGKSTIIKLLLRFYDVTSGQILIDGTDIREIAIGSWYQLIGTLFQDFNRYPFSIRENIHMGMADKPVNENVFSDVARQAGLMGMVSKLPFKFETRLSSEFKQGIEPSGGQWQRVALARVFYRQASLLILDEPTAAIDAKAEFEIFNSIFEHYSDKGALIVSHRFSTVRKAKRIIVLDAGRIIEQGNHEELIKIKGLYAEMFDKQAAGYR